MKPLTRTVLFVVAIRYGFAAMYGFLSGLALFVFLLAHYGYALQAEGARASGEVSASCASLPTLPDGNHGENVLPGADRD